MTNIILKIENMNDKTSKAIAYHAWPIAAYCKNYAAKKTEMKPDDFRVWLSQNDKPMFDALYCDVGAKGKLVMSQHSRNISGGMVAVGNFPELFVHTFDENDFDYSCKATSLSKFGAEMNKIEKAFSKFYMGDDETTVTTDENDGTDGTDDSDENDGTDGTDETLPAKTTLEQIYDVIDTLKLADKTDLRDYLNELIEVSVAEKRKANG
tara:strand:+ start:443 stop:1069 length:627 start_codon:yes stop_codon:yes gene_type:complete